MMDLTYWAVAAEREKILAHRASLPPEVVKAYDDATNKLSDSTLEEGKWSEEAKAAYRLAHEAYWKGYKK